MYFSHLVFLESGVCVCFGRLYWGKEVEVRQRAIGVLCTHNEPRVANNHETILKVLLIRRGTHFVKNDRAA